MINLELQRCKGNILKKISLILKFIIPLLHQSFLLNPTQVLDGEHPPMRIDSVSGVPVKLAVADFFGTKVLVKRMLTQLKQPIQHLPLCSGDVYHRPTPGNKDYSKNDLQQSKSKMTMQIQNASKTELLQRRTQCYGLSSKKVTR